MTPEKRAALIARRARLTEARNARKAIEACVRNAHRATFGPTSGEHARAEVEVLRAMGR